VPLTRKAVEILRVLVEHAGHVVSKDALLGAVWPDTYVHPDNVKVLVGEIRRALGDDPVRPQYIRSIVKRGYIFIAPVVEAPTDLPVPAAPPIFVGRDAEMEQLLTAFDAAAASNRRVVFVNGEGGIGKTSLCEAFLRAAATRHAMRAAWANCAKVSGPSEPYAPIVEILNRLGRSVDDDSIRTVLAKHAPSWLPRLPQIAGDGWRAPIGAAHVVPASRMLREIVTAIEAIAEQSLLVLWIEDIHWADPATIEIINTLGQRPDRAKLLILATSRPPDATPSAGALRRAQADLSAHAGATHIRLQPFTQQDVDQYLDERFGEEISSRASTILYRATHGNPLFLATAVAHLVRRGHITAGDNGWRLEISPEALDATIPASFATAVTRELDELAPDERAAIAAASVIGVEFSLWMTAQAANTNELTLEPVLEALARRDRFITREGVIELANGMFSPLYRFKHGLFQEIVFDRSDAAARANAHLRAGLATERLFQGREQEVACDLACYFHGAGDHARAARYFRLAADNARKRYTPQEATALLHGAVAHAAHLPAEERHRVEMPLLIELGQAQLASGDAPLAIETFARVVRRAEDERRPNDRIRALLALSEAQAGISQSESLTLARQISEAASLATDETLAASAAVTAGITELTFDGWSDAIADRCFDIWRALPRTGTDDYRSLAIRLLFLQVWRSAYGHAWTTGRRLLPSALRSGNLSDSIHCYYLLGLAALHLGRWGDAIDVAAEGAAIGDKSGRTHYAVSMRLLQAWIALEGQRWDEARRLSLVDRALIDGFVGCTYPLQMSLVIGGASALGQGRLDDAERDLWRLRDWYNRERLVLDWFWKAQLHMYLSELAMKRGDLEGAAREAELAQGEATRMPERTWRGRVHVAAAQVAIERDAFADAERHLRQARRETRGIEAPLASWRIEAVTATLLERTAQHDSARRARMRYERTFTRLEQSIDEHHLDSLGGRGALAEIIH
jgi:DNA-binding winged helix-turn-helix (wHTH) protein/tetratricopeptide (TPR) repeat protein